MPSQPLESAIVLVVDDDAFTRETTRRIVQRLGARTVLEAADGAEALLRFNEAPSIDLILCDLDMPGVDGIETLRILAARNPRARIILLSAADSRVLRSARETAAAFGLPPLLALQKPLTAAQLRDALAVEQEATSTDPSKVHSPATSADLFRGLEHGEFRPYYQPKVDMRTREPAGFEALVRWHHPIHGVLSPASFLGLAQDTGQIAALTDVMLELAVRDCVQWHRRGLQAGVSVNLPVPALSDRDLPNRLLHIVERQGLAPSSLTLEITEDGWLEQSETAREVLTRIRMRGFGLSIDDYGTGFSTAQQLLHAPFSELKIDQSFIRPMLDDEESAIVVASTILLAHRLKLKVVAEGVEDARLWSQLVRMGCDQAQGYYVARPLPAEQIAAWLTGWMQAKGSSGLADGCLQPAAKVIGRNRLQQVSADAELEGIPNDLMVGMPGQHDDRQAAQALALMLAQGASKDQSIHRHHADVADQNVGLEVL